VTEDLDALFEEAMKLTGIEFTEQLAFLKSSLEVAAKTVPEAVQSRVAAHASGSVIVLPEDDGTSAWLYYLKEAEDAHGAGGSVKFVVGRCSANGMWRISAVPAQLPYSSEYRYVSRCSVTRLKVVNFTPRKIERRDSKPKAKPRLLVHDVIIHRVPICAFFFF
jgi:hypothetical protein